MIKMDLKLQKRLAAEILKCSEKRVWLDPEMAEDIKEAITKADVKGLINDGVIKKKHAKGVSRGRARKRAEQRKKGRQKGFGSRKGRFTARQPRKREWINKIRTQRDLLNELRERKIITRKDYRHVYMMAKGGFFRSRRHIRLYIDEHGLAKK